MEEADAAALAADVLMMMHVRGHDVTLTPAAEVRLLRLCGLIRAEFSTGTKEEDDG